jgi:hypothetical protein
MRRLIPALASLALAVCAPAAHAGWFAAEPIDGPSDILRFGDVDLARDGTGGIVYVRRDGGFLTRFSGGAWSGPTPVAAGVEEIAVSASDGARLVVAWIAGGNVYGAVANGPGPLGPAVQLTSGGGASGLALDMGINGHAYAVWSGPGGGRDVRAARVDDGPWSAVAAPLDIDPARDAGAGSGRPKVAVSAEGNAVVIWGEAGHVFARRLTGTTLSTVPQDLNDPAGGAADLPDIDIEYDGSFAWAVFRQTLGGAPRSLARRLRGSRWEAPVLVDAGASTVPRIAIAGNGAGQSVVQRADGAIVASPLVFDAFRPPVAIGSGASPVVAFSERGEPGVAWIDGAGVVRGRFAEDVQEAFGPEAALSQPALGAVAAGDLAISSDRAGDMVVAMLQGPAGARHLSAAVHDIAPSRPSASTTQKWQRRSKPVLRWSSGLDLLGPQQFRIFVDGAEIATAAATRLRPLAPIADGVHRWQVFAVDRRGQVTAGRSRRLRIDTVPPAVTVRTRRSGRSVRVLARVRDTRGASGFDRVSIDYGDRSSRGRGLATTHRYRRGGRFTITVRGYDEAGNVALKRLRIRVR